MIPLNGRGLGLGGAVLWIALGTGASLVSGVASAAGPADISVHDAGRHFDQGVKLSEEGDWRAALIEFERANAIAPNYRVLYNMGQCRFQLQDYAGALDAFETYLRDGGAEIPEPRRKQVESTRDELRDRIGRLVITTNVSGAEISVDDVQVGTSPLRAPVAVSAGRRKVAVSKAGQLPATRYVDVAGKESIAVALLLAQPNAAPPSAPGRPRIDDSPPEPRPSSSRSAAPAYLSFGAAAAGVGIGTYFGVAAAANKRDLDRQCVDKVCPRGSQSLIDDAQRNATISTVALAAGAAFAVGGLALAIYAGSGAASRPSEGVSSVRIGLGLGTLSAYGAF